MSRTNSVYDERITIKVTGKMLADLENVTRKNGQTLSAVVRQAIRNYLDGTDLTLGTRRTFDRRFQKRMDDFEQSLAQRMERFLQRRAEDAEVRMERYLEILLFLCASEFAALPEHHHKNSWRVIYQAISDLDRGLGDKLRQTVFKE
jgi:hypothetical protein